MRAAPLIGHKTPAREEMLFAKYSRGPRRIGTSEFTTTVYARLNALSAVYFLCAESLHDRGGVSSVGVDEHPKPIPRFCARLVVWVCNYL